MATAPLIDGPLADGPLADFAPAKVNLTLRVVRRRADGYHDVDSLVVFARESDRLTLTPGDTLDFAVEGPTAPASGLSADNLVLKAAHGLAAAIPGLRLGRFALTKQLPVAAGIGGGSSDAAAALRLLARANGLAPDDSRLFAVAKAVGADVPVCVDPKARMMRGIGDILSDPLALPPLSAVLINPGVAVATKDVFARLALSGPSAGEPLSAADMADRATLLAWLRRQPNDLEAPAIAMHGVIADALAELRTHPGCDLARMSGSGATCFALFDGGQSAAAAARALHGAHPDWWVRATALE